MTTETISNTNKLVNKKEEFKGETMRHGIKHT